MPLHMSQDLWHQLCEAADRYPTCTLHLHQHQGWVRSFTIEHGPGTTDLHTTALPSHVARDMAPLVPNNKQR